LLNTKVTRAKGEKLRETNGHFSIQWTANSESNFSSILDQVKNTIDENTNTNNEKVQQKYDWLRTYKETHNG